MANNEYDNETTQPGRFGLGPSSLRDALRAVAGLREPTTRPEEPVFAPSAQPMRQVLPVPEPAEVRIPVTPPSEQVTRSPVDAADNHNVLLRQSEQAQQPVAPAPTPILAPQTSDPEGHQTALRRPMADTPHATGIHNKQSGMMNTTELSSHAHQPVQVAPVAACPVATTVAAAPVVTQIPVQEEPSPAQPETQSVQPDGRRDNGPITMQAESGSGMQEKRRAENDNAGDDKTRVVRGVQRPDRDDYYQEPVVAWLVVIGGPGLGAFRPVYEGNNAIGRTQTQRIAIDFGDDSISAEQQAYIRYDGTDRSFLFVPNLAKTNVVSVNELKPTSAVRLAPMDVITVGQTQLVFVPFCGPEFDWSELKDIQSDSNS